MRKKVVLNSPRLTELRRKKHKNARKKFIIFSVIFVFIILGLSFAFRIPAFNINDIVISGNSIVDTKDIEKIVKDEISGHYLLVFPKTNFLIYPKNSIKDNLADNYKRLKTISLNVENFRTLVINVSEYKGEYLWCGENLPNRISSINKKCYFMDEVGYVFDEAPYFSGEVYSKFYGNDGPSDENPIGVFFMKEKFADVSNFKKAIEKMSLKPTSFWTTDDKENGNFAISREGELGPKIIFKMKSDYAKLAENLQAAISTEPLHSDLQTKLSSLIYLDLRYGNKVYFKFK